MRFEQSTWAGAALVLAFLAVAQPAGAQTAKPPARAVAAQAEVQPATSALVPLLAAQLRKGKKGHILRVDVTARFSGGGSVGGSVTSVAVNGTFLTLPYPDAHTCSSATTLCAVNFTLWLDLDEAELLAPGTFIGEPLALAVEGTISFDSGTGTIGTDALMELIKK
jgi:hypothetical protein